MTMLLLHPIGLDHRSWQFVGLSDTLAVDLPGHGSAPMIDDLTMAGLADYLAARMPEAADVAGLSLGGMVALHLAVRHPSRVRSLVVACCVPATDRAILQQRAESIEQDGMAGTLEDTLTRWFSPPALAADHPGVGYARRRLLADDPTTVARYWRAMSDHDVRSALPSIGCPTTVLAGRDDQASSLDSLEGMAKAIRGSRFEVLPGPHMLHLECPEDVAKVLARHRDWAEQESRLT